MTTTDNNDNKKNNKTRVYCECGKSLADRHSLCKHRKICKYLNPPPQPAQPIDMMEFMKLQMERDDKKEERMMKLMEVMALNMGNKTTNNTRTTKNTQNNFKIYLNEDCKDAKSFSDFILELMVSSDKIDVCRHTGILETILTVFQENYFKLDKTDRPIQVENNKSKLNYKFNGQFVEDENNYVAKEIDKEVSSELLNYITKKDKTRSNTDAETFTNLLTKLHAQRDINYYDNLTKDIKKTILA